MARRAGRAVLLAAVLVVSIVAGSAALAGSAAAAPSGFVTVDDSQVTSDLPTNTPMGEAAQNIADAGVMSSAHPDSLEVVVTSPGRAKNVIDGGEIHGSGPISIVLTDDENSEGRTVALPAEEVRDALGFAPEMARGTHEDGTPWNEEIEYQDGWMLVDVPHFSTNTVSFAGQVQIGDTFTDESTVQYNLSDLDSASDPVVNLTGVKNTETELSTYTGLSDGESVTESIGGNAQPANRTVTVTGQEDAIKQWNVTGDNHASSGALSVSEGLLAVGDNGNVVDAYNTADGSLAWNVSVSDPPSGLAFNNGNLIVDDGSGLTAYSTTDQTETWSTTLDGDVNGLAENGSSVAVIHGENISLLDASTGSISWTETFSGVTLPTNGIGVDESQGNVVVSKQGTDTVQALDVADGSIEWEVSINDPGALDVYGDTIAVHSVENLEIVSLDPVDGDERWRNGNSVSDSSYQLEITEDRIVFSTWDKTLGFTKFGELMWTVRDGDNPNRFMAADGDYVGGQPNDGDIRYYGISWTQDPAVSLDGVSQVSHSGYLKHGETVSSSVDLSLGNNALDVSETGSVPMDLQVEYDEVTETQDPGVELNGNETVNHTGTLADGESVEYTLSKETLQEGSNTVNVSMPELSADAPAMQVGVEYSHDAQDDQTVDYDAEKFSERYNVSKTYASDRVDPTLTIPFADTALSMRNLEYQVNDGGWQTLSDYTLDNTTLTANLPDTTAGDSVEVRGTASKVSVQDGEIKVLDPTTVEDPLDSEIEITNPGDNFALDVSGIDEQSVHYLANVDYTDADPYALITASGTQEVYAPQATHGASVRVRSLPIWATPDTDVQIHVRDADTPRFSLKPGPTSGDLVEIEYRNTESGQTYELRDVTNDRQADTDQAESPVTFTVGDSAITYEIHEISGSSGPIAISADDDGGIPDWLLLIAAILVGVVGLAFAARRLGDGSGSSTALVAIGGTILGVFALELITPYSIVVSFVLGILDRVGVLGSSFLTSGFGALAIGVGLIVAVLYVDQRTDIEVSLPAYVGVGGLVLVFVLESLSSGIVDILVASLEEVGPLVWLTLIGGGAALIYLWIRAERQPDTQVTLDLGRRGK